MSDKLRVVSGRDIRIGDDFRIGGWKATVTDIAYTNDGVYVIVEFCVGESLYQRGEFQTLMDGPISILGGGDGPRAER